MLVKKLAHVLCVALLTCVAPAILAHAQAPAAQDKKTGAQSSKTNASDPLTGRFEGVAQNEDEGDIRVVLLITNESGNLSGKAETDHGNFTVSGSRSADDKINMKLSGNGLEVIFNGEHRDGRISGEWSFGPVHGTFEVRKVEAAVPASAFVIPQLTAEQWREDLRHLARELPKRHKNAFHTVTREQFERAVSELDANIPKLQPGEILLGMARVAAMIGDGHTGLNTGHVWRIYPVNLFWFGNELRVVGAKQAHARLLGARVVRIGDKDVEEAHRAVSPLIPQGENEWFARGASPWWLRRPEVLRVLGVVKNVERARWTFVGTDGKRFTLDLSPLPHDDKHAWVRADDKNAPLYRQHEDQPMRATYLPEWQTVFLNFRWYPDGDEFRRLTDEFFKVIDGNPTKRVVIDLRQNGGGDFTKGRDFLIAGLKKRGFQDRPNSLFVIIGRMTFSAAMVNAIDFKKDLRAVLVGEPTGARPNSYSENRSLILPNSKLTVSYSIRYYKFLEQDVPAVMPDRRIDPAWDAFAAGRDPVLEWIVSQPQTSQAASQK